MTWFMTPCTLTGGGMLPPASGSPRNDGINDTRLLVVRCSKSFQEYLWRLRTSASVTTPFQVLWLTVL